MNCQLLEDDDRVVHLHYSASFGGTHMALFEGVVAHCDGRSEAVGFHTEEDMENILQVVEVGGGMSFVAEAGQWHCGRKRDMKEEVGHANHIGHQDLLRRFDGDVGEATESYPICHSLQAGELGREMAQAPKKYPTPEESLSSQCFLRGLRRFLQS